MQTLGRNAVAAATVAVCAMNLGVRPGLAAPNVGHWGDRTRVDPPAALDTGIGPVGVVGILVLAPPVAGVTAYRLTLEVHDHIGGNDPSLYAFIPVAFGLVVGLSTCFVGLVSDGGQGNCPLVVLAAAGASLGVMGLAVAAESGEPLLLALFVPSAASLITYNVTAAEGAAPTIIVPSRANLQRAPLMFPLFHTSF